MPHTLAAFKTLTDSVGWFKDRAGSPRSLLYVGWREDCRRWWYDTLCKQLGITKVGVLEIFGPNVDNLRRAVRDGQYELDAISGDVRKIDSHVAAGEYDVIFWDHGPEHVSWEDLKKVTPLLTRVAGRLLLYCCPWGEWKQGVDAGGNEHEEHKNYVTVEQLAELGMTVMASGGPGQDQEGELIGFKFLNEYSIEVGK